MGNRKREPKGTSIIADVTSGAQWLHQISEVDLRDQILKDIFTRMKTEKAIGDFIYTHGRNEHGVDWVVLEHGNLSDRFVGIQAKSRNITKQGDSRNDSALAVKLQCESAYDNLFNWHGNSIRLDSVQLWTSAQITTDAEYELSAQISKHKIHVVKAEALYSLIEKYSPHLISKIPGLAEANYVRTMANPDPLSTRLLGIQLNPKRHFLEPRFSRYSDLSPMRVFDNRSKRMREEPPLYLENLLKSNVNTLIVGGELSGKTYVLKRIACKVAELGHLPVYIDAKTFYDKIPKNIYQLVAQHITWHSLSKLQDPESINRTIYLLIDNIEYIKKDQIDTLLGTMHCKTIAIITSKKSLQISGFTTYHISGVKFDTLAKFIRSLDVDSFKKGALADRATHYIQRAFGTSGLPVNPFTVSIMLAECRVAQQRLATPTMGRLIERFVEGQLGSHADSMRVDFETKNQFLTMLGGNRKVFFNLNNFRRKIAKFITSHGHPHELAAFEQDLIESGLIEYSRDGKDIGWTRQIFKEYYWTKNIIREKKFKLISNRLAKNIDLSIAAMAGSQLNNAHDVLCNLIGCFDNATWISKHNKKHAVTSKALPEGLLPSDADEDALLNLVENEANKEGEETNNIEVGNTKNDELFKSNNSITEAIIAQYFNELIKEKHYLVGNVASLLVNARGLRRSDKEKAAICVIRSNLRIVQHCAAAINAHLGDKISPLMAEVLPRFWGLLINDMMIGDAFLLDIYKSLKQGDLSPSERLIITDLLVVCGGETPNSYNVQLSKNKDLADIISVYFRLVYIYYFRFHKEKDKDQLREAMKAIRKLTKGFTLPHVN